MTPAPRCVSTRHAETDCLTRWSVSGGRFPWQRWCQPCQGRTTPERLDALRSPDWRHGFAAGGAEVVSQTGGSC